MKFLSYHSFFLFASLSSTFPSHLLATSDLAPVLQTKLHELFPKHFLNSSLNSFSTPFSHFPPFSFLTLFSPISPTSSKPPLWAPMYPNPMPEEPIHFPELSPHSLSSSRKRPLFFLPKILLQFHKNVSSCVAAMRLKPWPL